MLFHDLEEQMSDEEYEWEEEEWYRDHPEQYEEDKRNGHVLPPKDEFDDEEGDEEDYGEDCDDD